MGGLIKKIHGLEGVVVGLSVFYAFKTKKARTEYKTSVSGRGLRFPLQYCLIWCVRVKRTEPAVALHI